ncbi:hypothetical protein [Undibacterium umbellatum]|uniref:Type I restriction enzyme R protein N-terminal domain-containing protein n=1 Tax=Undibacterium umbellatum TaxID=2762300 RepID=A0ABR6Z8R7_9BURK|nr:hypothetical protein [Undibacterium umbellatum]MBC3908063.1 hypothetical protein [Undibacterium umbellatum]
MTLDIKGGLKNTSASKNKYIVFEELLSNSIDSYLIRKKAESCVPPFFVLISLDFYKTEFFNAGYDLRVSCTDNGAGFGEKQVKAFVTKDSTYKDYLEIVGIGKCKGAGRIQFFHYFKKLQISSILAENSKTIHRTLSIRAETREVSEESFNTVEVDAQETETTLILQDFNKTLAVVENAGSLDLREEFSAKAVHSHLYIAFLQRLIVLKGLIGEFSISIKQTSIDADEEVPSQELSICSKDLPTATEVKRLPLTCSHDRELLDRNITLNITRYSLPYQAYPGLKHEVALCANFALVQSLTKQFLKKTSDRNNPINGNFELILVEGEFLEGKVNEQRDGFNIPMECGSNGELDSTFSLQDIIDSLSDYVYEIITPSDFDKEKLIWSTQARFGITHAMLNSVNIKVHYSDTEENIARRVLRKFQDEIVRDTSDIFNIKEELLGLDPRTSDFREKVALLSWKYTSNIKKVDMANLSQLVVRRASMLEILKKATELMLICQDEDGKRDNEKIIHNIFFPRGKDNSELIDHDIWLLNEEYHYFEHIASDKALSSIKFDKSNMLFEPEIDNELEKLFAKNNKNHSQKRPDIAIFNSEGAAIIIEFKAPGVELQEHISDLIQYSRLLASKSNGKIKKFYGYLIGDTLDETRMPGTFTMFPSGLGYFNTEPVTQANIKYGELYSEILYYDQFIQRAEKRLEIYKKKLSIEF